MKRAEDVVVIADAVVFVPVASVVVLLEVIASEVVAFVWLSVTEIETDADSDAVTEGIIAVVVLAGVVSAGVVSEQSQVVTVEGMIIVSGVVVALAGVVVSVSL